MKKSVTDKDPKSDGSSTTGAERPRRRPYQPPRIILTEKLLVFGYACQGGSGPVTCAGCPCGGSNTPS